MVGAKLIATGLAALVAVNLIPGPSHHPAVVHRLPVVSAAAPYFKTAPPGPRAPKFANTVGVPAQVGAPGALKPKLSAGVAAIARGPLHVFRVFRAVHRIFRGTGRLFRGTFGR